MSPSRRGRASPAERGQAAGPAEIAPAPDAPGGGPGTPARFDAAVVRRTLREAGLRARHGLSQNFLIDPDVLQRILDEAAPGPGRRVLEIGPGLGILTRGLLDSGAAVTAVELDAGLAAWLRTRFEAEIARGLADPSPPGALRLVEGDILDQQVERLLEAPFDVVANLPYHITSPVLHRLLGSELRPDRLVLMLQREVAERIAAPPGQMSYLSVFVQFHAAVRIAFPVPRTAFEPEPEVDSAVLVATPFRDEPEDRLDLEAQDELWRLVQTGFRERRKMIHNVLSRQLPMPAARVERALADAGIAADRRPQTLGVGEWLALLGAIGPLPQDRRGRGPRS